MPFFARMSRGLDVKNCDVLSTKCTTHKRHLEPQKSFCTHRSHYVQKKGTFYRNKCLENKTYTNTNTPVEVQSALLIMCIPEVAL